MLDVFDEFGGSRDISIQTLYSDYVYRFAMPFERVENKVWWKLLFLRYWHHSITISLLYYAVLLLLQRLMRDKRPFRLNRPLFLFYASLAVFSALGLIRFSEDFLHGWHTRGLRYSLCYTCNPDSVAAFWSLLFPLFKLVEMGNMLFVVLWKQPLILLHYYQQAAVLLYTMHSGAEHSASGQAFITMNYAAQSIMYSYQAVVAYGKTPPKWVCTLVAAVRMLPMFVGLALTIYVYNLKVYGGLKCQQSMANIQLAFAMYTTFAMLFSQYYFINHNPTDNL